MTRILANHRRSLKQRQTNRYRDVISTSTSSNNEQECTGISQIRYSLVVILELNGVSEI